MSNHLESEWKNLVTAFPEDGTPSQDNVDQSFKFFVDILIYLDSIEEELNNYSKASYKERKEQCEEYLAKLEELGKEIGNKLKEEFQPITKKLEERADVIEPLITPPSSIDDVLGYLANVAAYFFGPYKALINQIHFYTEYSARMTEKINQIKDKLLEMIQSLMITIQDIESNGTGMMSFNIAQIEQAKASKELKSTIVRKS